MRAGFWLVRCCRGCPEVAARVWLCPHEPGVPENLMDRPFMQGQIGLDLVPPADVWAMVEFCEASPEERRLMEAPPLSERAPRNGRLPAFQMAPMAKWRRERARRISAARFEREIEWLRWAARNAPDRPEVNYRKPVDPTAVPIPTFGSSR